MNEKNRVIQLKRELLGQIQDLTAETLQMDRGITLKERDGKRGRKHISHSIYRDLANGHRLEIEIETNRKNDYANWLDYKNNEYDLEKEKIKEANKIIAEKDAEIARLKLEHKAEFERIKKEYLDERAELKASGEAKQADYQQLKKAHEEKVQDLEKKLAQALEKVTAQDSDITQLKEEKTKTLDGKDAEIARLGNEIARIKSEYAAERAELKASGTARQSDYQQLKTSHEAALAELTSSKAQAARTAQDLATAQTALQAAQKAQGQAVADKDAELAKVTAQAARTAQDLATAQTALQAAQQEVTAVKERYKELREKALEIQAERNELAAKVEAPRPVPRPTPVPQTPTQRPVPTPAVQAQASAPTLAERLKASLEAMARWIAAIGGQSTPAAASGHYIGPAKHMDELHCIQKTGRTSYTVHRLDALDAVPALDDPALEIRYHDGVGKVIGRLGLGQGTGR
jgi:chromosome segregation ATPase